MVPAVPQVRDFATGATLTRVGGSANRDMLGDIYQLSVPHDGGPYEVEVIVGDETSLLAHRHARLAGVNLADLRLQEELAYNRAYAAEFGSILRVRKFELNRSVANDTLAMLRNLLVGMLFNLAGNRVGFVRTVRFDPQEVERSAWRDFDQAPDD